MIVVTVDKDGDVVLRDQGTMIMLHFSLLIDYNWSKNSCTPLHTLGRGKGKSNPTRQGPLPLPPVYPCQYPQGTAYPCQTLTVTNPTSVDNEDEAMDNHLWSETDTENYGNQHTPVLP